MSFDIKSQVTPLSREEILHPFFNSPSNSIPLSQFDLMPRKNPSSFSEMTGDDSDVDMFEGPEETTSQPIDLSHSKFMADYSCLYSGDKSKFMPKFSLDGCDDLKKELFEISREEIQEKIDGIIGFLENFE